MSSLEEVEVLKGIICTPLPRKGVNDPEIMTMLKQEVPVVIQNSKLVEPAVRQWDLQFLSDYCGDENLFSVRASTAGSSAFIYADSSKNDGSFAWKYPIGSVDMPFSSFAAILAAKAASEGREAFQKPEPGHPDYFPEPGPQDRPQTLYSLLYPDGSPCAAEILTRLCYDDDLRQANKSLASQLARAAIESAEKALPILLSRSSPAEENVASTTSGRHFSWSKVLPLASTVQRLRKSTAAGDDDDHDDDGDHDRKKDAKRLTDGSGAAASASPDDDKHLEKAKQTIATFLASWARDPLSCLEALLTSLPDPYYPHPYCSANNSSTNTSNKGNKDSSSSGGGSGSSIRSTLTVTFPSALAMGNSSPLSPEACRAAAEGYQQATGGSSGGGKKAGGGNGGAGTGDDDDEESFSVVVPGAAGRGGPGAAAGAAGGGKKKKGGKAGNATTASAAGGTSAGGSSATSSERDAVRRLKEKRRATERERIARGGPGLISKSAPLLTEALEDASHAINGNSNNSGSNSTAEEGAIVAVSASNAPPPPPPLPLSPPGPRLPLNETAYPPGHRAPFYCAFALCHASALLKMEGVIPSSEGWHPAYWSPPTVDTSFLSAAAAAASAPTAADNNADGSSGSNPLAPQLSALSTKRLLVDPDLLLLMPFGAHCFNNLTLLNGYCPEALRAIAPAEYLAAPTPAAASTGADNANGGSSSGSASHFSLVINEIPAGGTNANGGPYHYDPPLPPRLMLYLQQPLYAGLGPRIVQSFNEFAWQWLSTLEKKAGFGALTQNLLLVGERGTVTPFHYDEQQNLFAQVKGRKLVLMASPSQFESLYPYPVGHPADRQSQVDLHCPDLKRFPRVKDLQLHWAVLAPGEVLFIPAFWWHHIESPWSESISLNFWHRCAPVRNPSVPIRDHGQRMALRRNIEKLTGQSIGFDCSAALFRKVAALGLGAGGACGSLLFGVSTTNSSSGDDGDEPKGEASESDSTAIVPAQPTSRHSDDDETPAAPSPPPPPSSSLSSSSLLRLSLSPEEEATHLQILALLGQVLEKSEIEPFLLDMSTGRFDLPQSPGAASGEPHHHHHHSRGTTGGAGSIPMRARRGMSPSRARLLDDGDAPGGTCLCGRKGGHHHHHGNAQGGSSASQQQQLLQQLTSSAVTAIGAAAAAGEGGRRPGSPDHAHSDGLGGGGSGAVATAAALYSSLIAATLGGPGSIASQASKATASGYSSAAAATAAALRKKFNIPGDAGSSIAAALRTVSQLAPGSGSSSPPASGNGSANILNSTDHAAIAASLGAAAANPLALPIGLGSAAAGTLVSASNGVAASPGAPGAGLGASAGGAGGGSGGSSSSNTHLLARLAALKGQGLNIPGATTPAEGPIRSSSNSGGSSSGTNDPAAAAALSSSISSFFAALANGGDPTTAAASASASAAPGSKKASSGSGSNKKK